MSGSTYRTIIVQPGIGDSIWLLQKLINAKEKFNFVVPGGNPQRGKQIFDILPQVAASCVYGEPMKYSKVDGNNAAKEGVKWSDIKQDSFYLSANRHLEEGKRIEEFLPDLPTSFKIPWATEQFADRALELLSQINGDYIGLYGSSYSTSRSWGFWDEHKWLELARMVYEHNPKAVFVIIGAEWDIDLGRNLCALLKKNNIPYITSIGESLGVVVEIMKLLKYFFSFPSGLGILAPTVDCPVTMFYPPHLEKMMNAWASPKDIQSGAYKGCQFCSPKQIFDWCIENDKL